MGLDMYLSASKYVGGWKHSDEEKRKKYAAIREMVGMGDVGCEESPSLTVSVTVAYWRKANAVHAWFVKNVQKGKDDCKTYYVERGRLAELAAVCEKVLANPELAAELLPSQSGFFFGSTAYDEVYLDDLRATVKQIKPLLDEKFERVRFEYHSSW